MGTSFSVKVVAPPAATDMEALERALRESLRDIENRMSTYIEDSELSIFNQSPSTDWIPVSQELCSAVASALEISTLSDGAFDITIGPLVNLWGFGPDGVIDQPPSDAAIRALMAKVGFDKLETDCATPALKKQHSGLFVDLSGWAKGFAVDQLADLLTQHGIHNFLAELGGEMRVHGQNAEGKDWAIAIEKPIADGREVRTILRLTDTGIATSGDYRIYFEYDGQRYSHTIDPRSGRPVTHDLASVTVFNASAATADGLATALLVLGPAAGPALAEEVGLHAQFTVRRADDFEVLTTGN